LLAGLVWWELGWTRARRVGHYCTVRAEADGNIGQTGVMSFLSSTIHDTAQANLSKGEKTGQVVTEFGAVLLVSAALGRAIPVSITF
jgi:hypothetical protein